jgi:cytochrome c
MHHTPALTALAATLMLALPLQAGANEALARKHGCLGCHAVATTLVGPAYQAVAERYAQQADAPALLLKKLRQGGAGTWGEVPMPPQAAVPEADAKRLVAWILRGAK